MSPDDLKAELLAMAGEDRRVREELARDGSLFDGYHPRMRSVHERNAARLRELLDEHGWPGRSLVGERAARAAWIVLQHAIDDPQLLRRGLALLRQAAASGDVPMTRVAMLEDRICGFEGRPQRYGTQFDWDEAGRLSPLPVEDAENVDDRRRRLGLLPIAEETRRMRELAAYEGEQPPHDWRARERGKRSWLRATGWRN